MESILLLVVNGAKVNKEDNWILLMPRRNLPNI